MGKIKESIFKRYDVRGKYPEEINEDIYFEIGKSFAEMMESKEVVVGYDIRNSSESLFESLASGINSAGAKVVSLGHCSTPAFYFAVCHLNKKAGLMITASHLGKDFNGLKLVGKNAAALNEEDIRKLKGIISVGVFSKKRKQMKPAILHYNIKSEYISALRSFLQTPINKMKVVIDCGGGMAALYAKDIFKRIKGTTTIFLFNELDGNFSGRGSNPKEQKNREAIAQKILAEKADLGIMYDGDADRVCFLDSGGDVIDASFVSSFMIEYLSSIKSGKFFVADIRSSKVIADISGKVGVKLIISPAWHIKIKEAVKKNKAVFGSETSGHYVFGDFYNIDDGILASLIFLQAISNNSIDTMFPYFSPNRESLAASGIELKDSSFLKKMQSFKLQYHILEETNFKIDEGEAEKILELLEEKYKTEAKEILKIDGLSMEFSDWRFNLRQSLSEPLLRLNMEADSDELLRRKFKEVEMLIKKSP